MKKRRGTILVCVALLLVGALVYHRVRFPYGYSHCCITGMMLALEHYAQEHGGKYPASEATPEASLSLLYKSNYVDAYMLRGMTVPEKTVRRILGTGSLLGPDSCGWQYVPGLTRADDSELALLWCKTALGHNGQRTKDGGRQVVFVGRGTQWISGAQWHAFLEEQKRLLSVRTPAAVHGVPVVTGVIELPGATRVDQIDGSYTMREESKTPDSSGSGTSSGTGLGPSGLVWYQPRVQNGSVTRTLSFSNLVSDPVTVTFVRGIPDVTNVIFKMRSKE
jgi:hypothetical protein